MPIYAYRCSTCGYAKDVLQKMSDPLLSVCPECGASTFQKQVTAAGFQLKGSGWYVTDFRGGDKPSADKAAKPAEGGDASKTESAPAQPAAGAKSESAPAAAPSPSPSPAPSPPSSSGSK